MPILYEKNTKKHPDSQLKLIAESLKEYGWKQPIVTDKSDVIIVGHGRWLAYQKYPEGIKEPWIIKADDLTPEQVRGYRLMDNKSNESDWDMALAVEELKDLDKLGFDISLTGFDKDLLIEPDEKDDIIPDNAPTRAKLGDVWALGRHRVMCGDSTDRDAVERLMDGKKADMVFTDPPYGVSYEAGLVDKVSRMKAHISVSRENTQIENDTITSDTGLYEFLLGAFKNIAECTKHGVYICYGSNRTIPFLQAFKDAGFHHASSIVWVKDRIVMGRGHYHYQYESILYGWKEKNTGKWMGDRSQSNVWNLKRPSINDLHPTMKPVELVAKALVNSSGNEDIVLDLFLGSGSTLIAAEKTGRICYGMELEPKYVDVIIQRYEDYTGDKAKKI